MKLSDLYPDHYCHDCQRWMYHKIGMKPGLWKCPDCDNTMTDLDKADAQADPLDAIGVRHGTDQSSLFHNYLNRFEVYFYPLRYQRINILEIGVADGKSLWTWREYFPNARLFGIDKEPCPNVPAGATIITGDIFDDGTWNKLHDALGEDKETHGLIHLAIDDGLHTRNGATMCFKEVYPILSKSGIYIIEDLHEYWDEKINPQGSKSVLEDLAELAHSVHHDGKGQCGDPQKGGDPAFIHHWKSFVAIGKA